MYRVNNIRNLSVFKSELQFQDDDEQPLNNNLLNNFSKRK